MADLAPAARLALISLAAASLAGAAQARSDLISPEAFDGLVDLRLAASDGERSWLDGGFGKTVGSGELDAGLAEAALVWKPRFSFSLSAVVTAELQPQLDPELDIAEAYLKYRAPPNPVGKVSARAGLLYPPISLEHDGVAWTTPDVLSASAINSWVGEEVLVGALEGTIERKIGGHELSATAAVFGWNDTSGTLLTFRGWALHGAKAGADTRYALPALSPWMQARQAPVTDPVMELDNRAGYYGRLEWRPPARFSVNALYYDNAGDRVAVSAKQWAWETRFLNLGLRVDLDERTKLLAQAMSGETLMGYRDPGGLWVDMGFHAAYVLASHRYGEDALTARLDWFETNDRTNQAIDDNNEEGWALAAAWRRRLAPGADLILEALHVESDRPSRAYAGQHPRQDQTTLQTALRFSF